MRPEAASKPRVRLVSVPCTGMDGNAGFKKLHDNLAADVDRAVEVIAADPGQGDRKKGDLSELYVYRFRIQNQLYLMG